MVAPCTYFSLVQELSEATHKDKPGWLDKHEVEKAKAVKHIKGCFALYCYQSEQGRRFLRERPWTTRPWKLECGRGNSVGTNQTNMCRFVITTHIEHRGGEVGLVKKPCGIMSSSLYVPTELGRICVGDYEHVPLVWGQSGGRGDLPSGTMRGDLQRQSRAENAEPVDCEYGKDDGRRG